VRQGKGSQTLELSLGRGHAERTQAGDVNKILRAAVTKDVIAWWQGEGVDPRGRLGRRGVGAVGAIGSGRSHGSVWRPRSHHSKIPKAASLLPRETSATTPSSSGL
jgi:hypothetical protein